MANKKRRDLRPVQHTRQTAHVVDASDGEHSISETHVEASMFSGPLPSPDTLREYNDVEPGIVSTIVRMAEKEQNHRHTMDRRESTGTIVTVVLGQIFAFLIALVGVGGGIYLAAIGQGLAGYSAMLTTLAGLVGVFIYGRKKGAVTKAEPITTPPSTELAKESE